MNFDVAYYTETGNKKAVNQDSICIKQIIKNNQKIVMAVICDGMGGLSLGELASATVVQDFNNWLKDKISELTVNVQMNSIKEEWNQLLHNANNKILKYGRENGIQLGTTVTALLLFDDGRYLVAHVGDTRLYYINNEMICQITEDQTYVAREIKLGHMTKEQAEQDSRRNVLLQCIGAVNGLQPEFYEGQISADCYMLLCSDGFRHQYHEEEIMKALSGDMVQMSKENMHSFLRSATNLCMQRGETDNISSVLIKIN
ncbi:MAG: serine/threonine-protein phosphatase [Lachnospiraceae bacterium]|nr:serine/threonine-protein phosphatase [Lachnospiraceae bacterium]